MIKLIIDTDLGCDCDDAGALAIANILHNRGVIEVLAVTHTVPDPAGAVCIDRINRYYGNSFPIGLSDKTTIDVERYFSRFAYPISYGHPLPTTGDAVAVMAETLERVAGNVTLVGIGAYNNIAGLVTARPDLIKRKVERIVLMGGCFPDDARPRVAEFNIVCDIAAAQSICRHDGTEIVFCDYYHGDDIHTGRALLRDPENPVREIYRLCGLVTRSSWDPIAVLYAACPTAPLFAVTPFGRVTVNDDGITHFTQGVGTHRLLKFVADKKSIEETLEKILQTHYKEKMYEAVV